MNSKEQSSRWWEGYIIRYAVGTVIGGLCVYFLLNQLGAEVKSLWLMQADTSKIKIDEILNSCEVNSSSCIAQVKLVQELYGFNFAQLALLGIYGLAFNYIASAPILVLHTTRNHWLHNEKESNVFNYFILSIALFLFFILCLSLNTNIKKAYINYITITLITCYILFQLLFIINTIFKNAGNIGFYKNLHRSRICKLIDTNSYKHLREHGNAFLMILHNLILFKTIETSIAIENNYLSLINTLIIWIIPACLVYFLGHKIEKEMIEDYNNFKS